MSLSPMQSDTRNTTGRPLSSTAWHEAQHRAKREVRRNFAARLATYQPRCVVDIGCATGLWLGLLDILLPPACEFIGIDSDAESLAKAEARAKNWHRKTTFYQCDVEADLDAIPTADVTMMFNLFPYLKDPARLLSRLAERPH